MYRFDQGAHQAAADAASVPVFGHLDLGDVRLVAHGAEADDTAADNGDAGRSPVGRGQPAESRADEARLRRLTDDRDALRRQIPRQIARDQGFDEGRDLEMIGGKRRAKDDCVTQPSSPGYAARKAGCRRS